MLAKKRKRESEREVEETCTFFGTFVETRYDEPKNIPVGDERLLYHVYCLCGMIDGDGMDCLLAQPESERRSLYRSARKLGLTKLVDNAHAATAALRRAGVSLKRKSDQEVIDEILKPFERMYFDRLRHGAYARMYRLISASDAFIPYALNCQRMQKEGGNPFDPKEWTPAKMKGLG
jgi:hypothetical protein